jgi:hypothetical protein
VRISFASVLIAFLSVVATTTAYADTQLTGKWVGQFNGIQVEIPLKPGPFGYPGGTARSTEGPRFTQTTLQLDFDTQKNGLSAGTWNAGEFKQRFACAQFTDSLWNCVDGGGRASVEVKSATEIRVCYLDNREGAQGAGCALLRKSG